MGNYTEDTDYNREAIKNKLRQYFDGKIVRKDLTKKIKEGANVPVYVLEFLLYEQGGGKLISEDMCNPVQVYTVSRGKFGKIGVFRLESQMLPGNGKFDRTGLGMTANAQKLPTLSLVS